MPKAKKLHVKRKPIALQKNFKIEEDENKTNDTESLRDFELQLCWCINQLEKTLNEKKGTEKQLQEAWKTITILKSNNQPVIRKRQLMRKTFGDYRALMAAEEKRLCKMASKMKISEATPTSKATFLRKSAFLTNGGCFKFNFDVQNVKDTEINIEGNESQKDCEANTKPPDSIIEKNAPLETNKITFPKLESEFKFNFNIDND